MAWTCIPSQFVTKPVPSKVIIVYLSCAIPINTLFYSDSNKQQYHFLAPYEHGIDSNWIHNLSIIRFLCIQVFHNWKLAKTEKLLRYENWADSKLKMNWIEMIRFCCVCELLQLFLEMFNFFTHFEHFSQWNEKHTEHSIR